MALTYTYDPAKIRARGKDQMRFELGDTAVEQRGKSSILSDEEYEAVLGGVRLGKRAWLFAKLTVLEAILFKLSYMVDTKIDVLTYGLGKRAEQWQALYDKTRKQYLASAGVPTIAACARNKPAYFRTDMQGNPFAHIPGLANWPFYNMVE